MKWPNATKQPVNEGIEDNNDRVQGRRLQCRSKGDHRVAFIPPLADLKGRVFLKLFPDGNEKL
jgi:hypothetical protein